MTLLSKKAVSGTKGVQKKGLHFRGVPREGSTVYYHSLLVYYCIQYGE